MKCLLSNLQESAEIELSSYLGNYEPSLVNKASKIKAHGRALFLLCVCNKSLPATKIVIKIALEKAALVLPSSQQKSNRILPTGLLLENGYFGAFFTN